MEGSIKFKVELPTDPLDIDPADLEPLDDQPIHAELVGKEAKSRKGARKVWADLVHSTRERYQQWKKELVQRTDATLEAVAERYAGDWREESPTTLWQKAKRGVDAAWQSRSLKGIAELGLRGVLVGAEFSAQLAARQFVVDIAIRQADCDRIAEQYDGLEYNKVKGVAAVEAQAINFASEVKRHFDELRANSDQFMPEDPADRVVFRDQRIAEGMDYARELLKEVTIIPAERRQFILDDIQRYLDTELFDSSSSSVMRGYEKLSRRYRNSVQNILEKHIDLYQARKARTRAILTTTSRWLTFGTEAFLAGRAVAAYSSVNANYERALQQIPVDERTDGARLLAVADSVRKSLRQFMVHGQLELVLQKNRQAAQDIQTVIAELITPEQAKASDADFNVDKIANALWERYQTQLEANGVTMASFYDQIEDLAAHQGDRRAALGRLLERKVFAVHRETIKATAKQFEYAFQQINTNVTALGALQHIDQSVEHVLQIREAIGDTLSRLGDAVTDTTITQVAHPEPVIQSALAIEELPQPTEPIPVTLLDDEIDPATTVTTTTITVERGDTAWKIVSNHLSDYRLREGNPDLSMVEAVALFAQDNQLASASAIHEGQRLQVPSESFPEEPILTSVETTPTDRFSVADVILAAKAVDAHQPSSDLYVVEGAHVGNLETLPPNEYVLAFGDRWGSNQGKTMAVHYDGVYALTVTAEGTTQVRPLNDHEAPPMTLNDLLLTEQSQVVRVFTAEQNSLYLESEPVDTLNWSQLNLAKIGFLQEHAVRVVEQDGTYCAKDIAGRLDLIEPGLASRLGITITNEQGVNTGVTVHAPMLAEAMIAAGGRETATVKEFFTVDERGAHAIETLNSDNGIYRQKMDLWIKAAAEHPLQVGTFLFSGTHIQDIIAANRNNGGEPNSHGVTLLGVTEHEFNVQREGTLAQALQKEFGFSRQDLAQRGYLLESLGITVNGVQVTGEVDWLNTTLVAGDEIAVRDVALNHRFNGDRADTLVTMMVQTDAFRPVSIIEPNPTVLNAALQDQGLFGADLMVDTFTEIKPAQNLAEIFTAQGLDGDLWRAAEYTLAAQGIDANHLEPGQLIPIFNNEALREHLDQIYTQTEARLGAEHGTVMHIVRPNEGMSQVAAAFFDRSQYSNAEWKELQAELADALGILHGQRDMPGDMYTQPYTVTEYHLQADAQLELDTNTIATMELAIWEDRLAERIYLPNTLPIATEAGVVETAIPKEVVRLIDTVLDANPNYGEDVRAALALVYANEGMRETADKTLISQALGWVNEHLPNRSTTLDQMIETTEYLASRQMQKDVAWGIHDNPLVRSWLDYSIAKSQALLAEHQVSGLRWMAARDADDLIEVMVDHRVVAPVLEQVSGTLEKVAGVSSAGLFQVRANNFLEETDPGFERFEADLRADPLLNTAAAAEILHRNQQAIDTYLAAFNDPRAGDTEAEVTALVNSYNGGPYKTMLGALQERLLVLSDKEQIATDLDKATGRDTAGTRAALLELCTKLSEQGKFDVSPDQIQHDIALLGNETIAFLRSETMQQLKATYQQETGEALSILPTIDRLQDQQVSYGNYALLATRGGALDAIVSHSTETRIVRGDYRTQPDYAKNDLGTSTIDQGLASVTQPGVTEKLF